MYYVEAQVLFKGRQLKAEWNNDIPNFSLILQIGTVIEQRYSSV